MLIFLLQFFDRFNKHSSQFVIGYGLISLAVGADQFGPCLDSLLPGAIFEDASTPPSGDGFAYLIQGVDSVCGSGTLGSADGITERVNLDPSACP